jgi:hypothetical protein
MKLLRRLSVALAFAFAALFTVTPASAQSCTDACENATIDFIHRAQTWTIAANLDFALFTSACSDSAAGTEVSGGSYARASVARSLANFAGTQSAGSTTASTGTGGQTSNNVAINFPAPSAGWGTVTHVGGYSGATLLICFALTTSKTINSGDTVSFAIGAYTYTQQ